jgi:hypothetical protein
LTLPATKHLLWLTALLLVPLPMLQFGAFVPVVRYLILAAVNLGLIVTEGGGEIPYIFFALLFGHALVYATVFWFLAGLLVRALWLATPRYAGRIVVGASLTGLALALLTRPYVTPYSGVSLHSNLWVVFQ